MENVHPDAAFRDHATALTRKVNDTAQALALNRDVYQSLAALKLEGALLVAVDHVTSGGAHLTRTVVHSNGFGGLVDVAKRRLIDSASGLGRLTTAITCAVGVVLLYLGVRHREEIFAPLAGIPAFMAGIWGAFAATIVGTLANDSGPLMFEAGLLMLLLATGYGRSRREPRAVSAGVRTADSGV